MADIIYPGGIKFFKSKENHPDWIIGNFVISIEDLVQWVKDNPTLLSDYNGKKQIKCDLRKGKDGPYVAVNTWKPASKFEEKSDLPF